MKHRLIYVALLMLFTPACFAVTTSFNNIFQVHPDFTKVSLQNSIFERDTYNGIGVDVTLSDLISSSGRYNVPVGSTWTWQLYRVENEQGALVNQLITELNSTYQGEVGDCLYQWSTGYCGPVSGWKYWWRYSCASEGKYRFKVLFNGSSIGEDDFLPSRFTPEFDYVYVDSTIQPKLTGDNFASKNMPTINEESAAIYTRVVGVAGHEKQCKQSLSDVIVKLTNTIKPGSGSHAHFTDVNELGTGQYVPLKSGDILDPDTSNTNKTVIEGETSSTGVFRAEYKAGEFGVKETITMEARRDATDVHPERKSKIATTKDIDIKAPNLVAMPEGSGDGEFYFVYGGSCAHSPTARWAVPEMKSRLVVLDALYKNKFGSRLSFNDASLQFGGEFDNKTGKTSSGGRDSRCHQSHRRGNDIDLNQVDEGKKNILIETYLSNGVSQIRLQYIKGIAKELDLEQVPEANSIHFRNINY